MKIPKGLQSLLEDGIIDGVVRQLQSGKEAAVFVVLCAGEQRCAKVYKQAEQRSFSKSVQYTEGRKSRRSRDARASAKGSRHGRKLQESQWKNAEVDALYLLATAGVRVPRAYGVFDGVLLMEMVCDDSGLAAPRLGELVLEHDDALRWHDFMIEQIVRMLCAGLIHGDLSEYNVLVDAQGPVIIDLPQAVQAAGNNNAYAMLERDVVNMRNSFGRYAPALLQTEYAPEIWSHYESGTLKPELPLTGRFEHHTGPADVEAVLDQIDEARWEAEARQRGREEAQDD